MLALVITWTDNIHDIWCWMWSIGSKGSKLYMVICFDEKQNCFNSLRPKQNGHHFADDIFKCIFLNENIWILLQISLKFVPEVRIKNIPALVQIMAWRRPSDKHYLNQWWLVYWCIYASLGLNELKYRKFVKPSKSFCWQQYRDKKAIWLNHNRSQTWSTHYYVISFDRKQHQSGGIALKLQKNKQLGFSWWISSPKLQMIPHHMWIINMHMCNIIIPPETKFRGGILDSPCSSVRPSVRPSVCLSVCLSVRPWVGVRVITLILFSGFEKFLVDISLGSRSCMGLNISVLPH